jgi:sortase B
MKQATRKVIRALVSVLFMISVSLTLRQLYFYYAQYHSKAQAIELAGIPAKVELVDDEPAVPLADAPEELPMELSFLKELDLAALREQNAQVLGWIYIPGTEISYPLMADDSNYTYLSSDWTGGGSTLGSIFMECENSRDLTDFNTIIYGHNIVNGSMFGTLKDFGQQDYFDSHREIYLVTDGGVYRYTSFASNEAQINSDTYKMHYKTAEKRLEAIGLYTESSVVESDLVPNEEDNILTLSTCVGYSSYYTRWVVQAVQTGMWETEI